MEFPISKARLQSFNATAALSKKRVNDALKEVCDKVEETVVTGLERKYVYYIAEQIKYGSVAPQNAPGWNGVPGVPILDDLMTALRQTFPDCEITMDPLKTYVVISWEN